MAGITETIPKQASNSRQEDNPVFNFEIPGYKCYYNNEGRGVCLYARNDLVITRYPELEKLFTPSIICEVKTQSNETFTLCLIYRSPNSTNDENANFLLQFNLVCKKFSSMSNQLLIMGDFNFPQIDWGQEIAPSNECNLPNVFLQCVHDNFLSQLVNSPTHHRGLQNPTLIDLILTNSSDFISHISHHAPFGNSHHSVLLFTIGIKNDNKSTYSSPKFQLRKGNYGQMREHFSSIEWDNILLYDSTVEDWWSIIYNKIKSAMDMFIPKKAIKLNTHKRSFQTTPDLLSKIKLKRSAFKMYKKFPTIDNYNYYVNIRNRVKEETRKITKNKEKQIARDAKKNPKAFYQYISSKTKIKESVSNLIGSDGKTTENDEQAANVLLDFFSSVFTVEDNNTMPNFPKRDATDLNLIQINEEQMYSALKQLNVSKSPGPDEIHPLVLNELASELAYPLMLLFNKTINEGKIPSFWKVAEVRPIFKKGSKSSPGNYRPVSLTSVVCKVFESFIRDALYDHLTSNNLLSLDQFGFCKGRSCLSQLLVTIHEWMDILDKNLPLDAIYLDFSKAFDTVPHKRLLHKLKGYGINNNILSWIADFLQNRSHYVSVNGSSSERAPVTSGVPQGSVLGPILFIYYINDMPDEILCKLKMFADDAKTFRPMASLEDSITLQKCIYDLNQWSDDWLQKFNIQKCNVMHLGRNNPNYSYNIISNGITHVLNSSCLEKDLGVYVDPELDFSNHISIQTKKARGLSGLLLRSIEFKYKDILVPLFKSLIRPTLEYGNTVWNPMLKKHINAIESVQRSYTKRIIGMGDLDYSSRLKELKLPSLEYRRFRGDLIEMYKICNNVYDPKTVKSLFEFAEPDNRTRGHCFKVKKRRTNTKKFQHYFTNRIVNVWNGLPEQFVCAKSLNVFKNFIDAYFKDIMYNINLDIY